MNKLESLMFQIKLSTRREGVENSLTAYHAYCLTR